MSYFSVKIGISVTESFLKHLSIFTPKGVMEYDRK